MTKNRCPALVLSADQNLVLSFHERHHPIMNMLRRQPLVGSTLTQSELDALPDLLCDYLEERDETWVSFAKRAGVMRQHLVDLLLHEMPLGPKSLARVLLRIAQDDDADGGAESGPDQLRGWLFENRVTQVEFAAKVGMAMSWLSQILNGIADVSDDFAARFELATNGDVPASAFTAAAELTPAAQKVEMTYDEIGRVLGVTGEAVRMTEREATKKILAAAKGDSARANGVRRMMAHHAETKSSTSFDDHVSTAGLWNWDVVTEMTSRRSCRVLMRDGKPVNEIETKPTMALDHKSKTWKAMNAAMRKANAAEVEK